MTGWKFAPELVQLEEFTPSRNSLNAQNETFLVLSTEILATQIRFSPTLLPFSFSVICDVASRISGGLVFGIVHPGIQLTARHLANYAVCSQVHRASPTSGAYQRAHTECLVMAWYAYCIGEKQAFPELARHRKPVPMESLLGVSGNQVFLYPASDLAVIVSEHNPAEASTRSPAWTMPG